MIITHTKDMAIEDDELLTSTISLSTSASLKILKVKNSDTGGRVAKIVSNTGATIGGGNVSSLGKLLFWSREGGGGGGGGIL